MTIGLIDTGIDKSYILENKIKIIKYAHASIKTSSGKKYLEFYEYSNKDIKKILKDTSNNSIFVDKNGHGTKMIGLIERFCNKTEYIICRIFDESVKTYDKCFIESFKWMIEQKPGIINLSIGSFDEKMKDILYKLTLKALERKIIVCCAGYENPSYPALFDTVITVVNEKILNKYKIISEDVKNSINVIVKNKIVNEEIKTTSEACAIFTGFIANKNKKSLTLNDLIYIMH